MAILHLWQRIEMSEGVSEEQQAAVRRRAMPVAAAGAIMGVAGMVIPFTLYVSAYHPPSLMAMNLSFSAMMIGVGIIFYAKRTPGTGLAKVLCVVAILAGMVGSFIYSKQAVDFRQVRETLELANVKAIAEAAGKYAAGHEGQYAADILVLLDEHLLKGEELMSPFGKGSVSLLRTEELKKEMPKREDRLKEIETASDYLYLGADLKSPPGDAAKAIIVAASTNTVMRVNLAIGFADGHSTFITVDEAEDVMNACNEGRAKMGLGILKAPAIIQTAIEDAKAEKKP